MIINFILDRVSVNTEDISSVEFIEEDEICYISKKNSGDVLELKKTSYSRIMDLWNQGNNHPNKNLYLEIK